LQHDEVAAAANNLTWVSYTANRPHCAVPKAKSSKSADHRAEDQRRTIMLGWAITFLVIALIAAILGFGVVAGTAAAVAKVLFVVFIVLFLVSLATRQSTPVP
jgi:uncharacterized membrane protein YtjA (UPF0391 family)